MMSGSLLGIDLGSSSVKASLLDIDSGKPIASASAPDGAEMEMPSPQAGWAEQDPAVWWENILRAAKILKSKAPDRYSGVEAIGISYQMHGLVLVDQHQNVLRPAIIWCDSRAVDIGNKAFQDIGQQKCLSQLLNSPGNFTAAKLKWVQENQPDLYQKIHKAMLPGDYVAMKLSGEINTTISGLSEGIFWDYTGKKVSKDLLDYFGIDASLLPNTVDTFGEQGLLQAEAAGNLALNAGIPITYRAGDQPNNALSLNVLNPGEIAATAGTSGVVYGIMDRPEYDPQSRVNSFVNVNHSTNDPRYGVLLCINGTGILNSWLRKMLGWKGDLSYPEMNDHARIVPPGSEGVQILPFGNGAERVLGNRDIGAQIHGLQFNQHRPGHIFRAAQEGIVYALNYGLDVMKEMGLQFHTVRAGFANMFLSPIFREAFVNATGSRLELYDTDGSAGAARGAGIGKGLYDFTQAFAGLNHLDALDPQADLQKIYMDGYENWKNILMKTLKS